MMIRELLNNLLAGERGGTVLWKIAVGEIDYPPVTDPSEGVVVATLAENILRLGQLQPILVSKVKGANTSGQYRLIAGRRRLEAIRMLGRTHINAIVVACEDADIPLLALSDNLLHHDADYWRVSELMANLAAAGWTTIKLSRLLGMSQDTVERLMELRGLPQQQRLLLDLASASMEDAIMLLKLPQELRTPLLKSAQNSERSIAGLVESYLKNPDPSTLQLHRVWAADVRLFVNTLRRSAETMEKAGFDCEIAQQDEEDGYTFTIRLRKHAAPRVSEKSTTAVMLQDVSRETLSSTPQFERTSLLVDQADMCDADNVGDAGALSIFRAIAEDEVRYAEMVHCEKMADDVSRETIDSGKKRRRKRENAEKLEICIDETAKR